MPAVASAVTTYEALLSGLTWNGFAVPNKPTFLTFSFDTAAPPSLQGLEPDAFLASFQEFTEAQQAMARDALKAWADACGITFFEVPPGEGDIRFGVYDFRFAGPDLEEETALGIPPLVIDYPDGVAEVDIGGDVLIGVGNVTLPVLLREIGHALGFKTPSDSEPTLDASVDDRAHTVLSANEAGPAPTGLGPLDVAAAEFVYGPASSDGSQVSAWSWDAAARRLTQSGTAGPDDIAGVATRDSISAGAGDDYVFTRAGDDSIGGEDGSDTLSGGDGNDAASGGAGDDIVNGDFGDDVITGGDGDDELYGVQGGDTIDGGLGGDYISGGSGANRLIGGSGNDTIVAVDGRSSIEGGDGFDELWLSPLSAASVSLSYADLTAGGGTYSGIESIVIFGDINADTLQGGDLPDFLIASAGADSLLGGASEDDLFGDAGADTLSGGGGGDFLSGDSGDDVILPGEGGDDISGGAGVDTVDYSGESEAVNLILNAPRFTSGGLETTQEIENVVGSTLADNLRGDLAANRMFGGLGGDTVDGAGGLDYLRGDEGDDSLTGGVAFDDANGNMGNDTVATGAGEDYCVGGKDSDSLSGGADYDLVYGNLGADTCDGGDGDDIVRGGQDADVCLGGAGNDFVSGDKGDDTVTGGSGADRFHTFGDAGLDRVTDFSLADGDRVQLDPGTQFTVAQSGADTVITMVGGGQMVLVGVQMSTLTPGWIFGA